MSLVFLISIGAVLFGLVSFGISLNVHRNFRKNRDLLEFNAGQIEQLEAELDQCREILEQSRSKTSDQARRIAWLETRIRKPEKVKKEVTPEPAFASLPKSNITERRHRVLTLASRGQDVETIATTLGMLKGEVELIINMGRSITNYA
ncbi:MAG: hypothetical protein R2747_03795 [Pyrinomonadaceae bacterium]